MKLSANKSGMLILSYFAAAACYAADAPPTVIGSIPVPPPIVNCVITGQPPQAGNEPQPQSRFDVKTPAFYYVCSSDNASPGQQITGVWIAVNTRGIMPDNTVLSTSVNTVYQLPTVDKPWTATYLVTMPPKGWPVGEYRIDLYYGDQIINSQNLTVTFNTNAW